MITSFVINNWSKKTFPVVCGNVLVILWHCLFTGRELWSGELCRLHHRGQAQRRQHVLLVLPRSGRNLWFSFWFFPDRGEIYYFLSGPYPLMDKFIIFFLVPSRSGRNLLFSFWFLPTQEEIYYFPSSSYPLKKKCIIFFLGLPRWKGGGGGENIIFFWFSLILESICCINTKLYRT